MDGGEQMTISPEFLENIQSAVNSQGVLGQVQVIETENGPVTVLFMEEGADTSSFGGENITLSVSEAGQGLGETVIEDANTEVQYQYHVQTDNDYTQLLQGAVGDTIVSDANPVSSVKEDLAVEPVIDLPQVPAAVQSTVTETFQQPESETSTDTYYITETGEILKIDSSLLGENAGDATLQLQTQDGTLQILNQVGSLQTSQVDTQLPTYTQPAVDTGNINITYDQSTPSFEYTATKVDTQGVNTEVARAEEPKVLSYKTTNRQRTNIMRQPVSRAPPTSILSKPTSASSQTGFLPSSYHSVKQVDASGQTTEIVYPKPYQKHTIVYPKIQKQSVNTGMLKSGQQSYQTKTYPQKMITTVVKPQSLLKSNASHGLTSVPVVNKPIVPQIPASTRSITTSTYTQRTEPAVSKMQSKMVGTTRVPAVIKQQTDLLSVAMKQAEVSNQILTSSVQPLKKVATPAVVKETVVAFPSTVKPAECDVAVENIAAELVSTNSVIESSKPTSNETSLPETTPFTKEQEIVPPAPSEEKVETPGNIIESLEIPVKNIESFDKPASNTESLDTPVDNIESQSNESSESKMEIDQQPSEAKQSDVEKLVKLKEDETRETEKSKSDSSSKQVSINSFSKIYNLQDKSTIKNVKSNTVLLEAVQTVKKNLKVSSLAQTTNMGSENDANNDGTASSVKKKQEDLHCSGLKSIKISASEMEEKNQKVNDVKKVKEKITAKKAFNLPIKKILKCEKCSFMTKKKSDMKQHILDNHTEASIPDKPKLCLKLNKQEDQLNKTQEASKSVENLSETKIQSSKVSKKIKTRKRKVSTAVTRKGKLNKHLYEVNVARTFSCGKCKKSFVKEVDRLKHVMEGTCTPRVTIEKNLKSEDDEQLSGDDNDVDSDSKLIGSDKDSDQYNYSLCTSILRRFYLKHQDLQLPVSSDKCFRCAVSLKTLEQKVIHVCRENSKNIYFCQDCGKIITSKRGYLLHKDKYPFRCPSCKFGFLREHILKRHLQKCGSAKEMRYLALVESYREKNRSLKKEIGLAHHRCHMCNKHFLSVRRLRFHQQMVHDIIPNPKSTMMTGIAGSTKINKYIFRKTYTIRSSRNSKEAKKIVDKKATDIEQILGRKQIYYLFTDEKSPEALHNSVPMEPSKRKSELKPVDKSDPENLGTEYGIMMDQHGSVITKEVLNTAHAAEDTSDSLRSKELKPVSEFIEYSGHIPEGLESYKPLMKAYKCAACSILCADELSFKRHMLTVHRKGAQCKVCKKKSITEKGLSAHMIDKHLVGEPLTCPECNKAFKKTNAYWRHAVLHIERFSCEVCCRGFRQKRDLTDHLKVHVEVKEFCVRCGQVFDNHDLLRIHSWKEHKVRMNKRLTPLHIRTQRRYLRPKRKRKKTIQMTIDTTKKTVESAVVDAGTKTKDEATPSKGSDKQLTQSSTVTDSNLKSIDVPDSDVTIQLFADGTLVTRDKAGTNYSQVKLEDLGLDLSMLEGNTDIELLIVQGDGKEVRATINTSKHVNPTTESVTSESKSASITTAASSTSGTKLTASSSVSTDRTPAVNEARPYKCSMCPRTFKFYRTFRCHEIVHTKAVTFTCHLCQRLFAREVNLQSHLELHKKKGAMRSTEEEKRRAENNNKCEQCKKIFSSVNALQRHIKDMHEEHPKVPCPICGKMFKNEGNVQRHSKIHVGPFTCPHCVKVFTDRIEYYEHIKSEHEDLMYHCKECSAVLPSKRAFVNHTKTQHANSDELIDDIKGKECTICHKRFEDESELETHLLVHSITKSHECPACHKKYKLLNTLEKHIKEVHNNDVIFTCSKCDEKFEQKGKLDLHVKLFHTGNYQCLTCYEDFPERTMLEEHQHKDHDFALECSKCKEKFETSQKLKNHLKEHTSQNNLCDICGAGFEHKAQLRGHLINKHFGREKTSMLKQYPSMSSVNIEVVCDLCGEFWHNKPLYKQHLRDIHFGGDSVEMLKLFPTFEKIADPPEPVTCDHCGKKCISMTQLNFHLRTHVTSKRKSVQTEEEESYSSEDEQDPYDFTNIEPREMDKDYECKKCSAQFSRKAALEKHMSVHKKDEFKEALKHLEKEEIARAELEEKEGYKPTASVKKVAKESFKKIVKTPKQGKAGKLKLPFPKTKAEPSPSSDTTPNKRKASKVHICKVCKEIFKTTDELVDHMHNDHDDFDFKADTERPSGEQLVEFDLLTFHCKSCDKRFTSRKNLRKHLRGVHKYLEKTPSSSELFRCTECEREFTMKSNMARHMMAKHDIKLDGDESESPTKTGKKERKVSEGSDDSCESMDEDNTTDITSFLGKNFNLGKTHSCNIQSVKKKQHKCTLCGEGFSRDATLKKHLALHATDDIDYDSKTDIEDMSDLQPAIYTCISCGNVYSTALGLIHHTRSKHSEVDEETVLAQIAEIDAQLKLDSSPKKKLEKESTKINKKRKFEAEAADDARENAKKRLKLDRDGKESYDCKFCGAVYYTYKGLIKHESEVHDGVKMESPQSVKYSHSGRMITKSKKLSEQIHCDKCNKTFLEEKGLKQHIMRVHKMEETVKAKTAGTNYGESKCDLCPKEFDQRINLRRHMKMKHNVELPPESMSTSLIESPKGNMVYDCDVCIQKFSTLSSLRNHMMSAHDEKDVEVISEDKVCNICSSTFATEKALEVHMRKHTGEKPYKCCLCNKDFISKYQLESHMIKLHPKQWAKKVKCKICLMLFETQKAMFKHKVTHRKPLDSEEPKGSKSEPSQHKCNHCEKMFRWKRNLVSHVEVYHTESDPQTCGVCNKVFPDKESIKEHMVIHNKTKRELPTCKICDKTFKKQSSLKMHVAQLHKEKSPPKGSMSCDICKESFATKMKLLEHMLSHTSVMPHKCDICSASFHLEMKLKAHKLTHKLKEKKTEGKNILGKGKGKVGEEKVITKTKKDLKFQCKKCSKKFSEALLLRAHVSKVHKTKLLVKTSLPKERVTRSRSLSETKTNTVKPASSKEKTQLKEKKVVKKELKKTQSSFCKKCNLNFIKKDAYETHMSTVHEKEDQGKKILTKGSGNVDKPKKTEKSSANKKSDEKKESVGKGPGSAKLDKQSTKKKSEEKNNTVGFDCPICKKIFSKQFKLKTHIKNVHKVVMEDSPSSSDSKRKKCLYCNQCARVFWSQKQYDTHNKKFHPDKDALELDKQVMEAMGEGDIKTEPADVMSPKHAEFETIQHKCEFCSMVYWTKKLFDEHMLSEHPEHAAEYGITGEDDTSSPVIEFVNDSEDMIGNLLSVGSYDVSACNKLSSLPVVSIQRINGKLDNMAQNKEQSSEKDDAGESSSDAESEDADEYTKEYEKFLQNSVIDVSENTEENETEDELVIGKSIEKNEAEVENLDEPVTKENTDDWTANEDTTEILDTKFDENKDTDSRAELDEGKDHENQGENEENMESEEETAEEAEIGITEKDEIGIITEKDEIGIINEEDSSESSQLLDEPKESDEQDAVNNVLISKEDALPENSVAEENLTDQSVDNCIEECDKSEVAKDQTSNETNEENTEESEIEKEQEVIDWEAIDNEIEAAVQDDNDEELLDDEDGEEREDKSSQDMELESKQEMLICNEDEKTEAVEDIGFESCEAESKVIEGASISENKANENNEEIVSEICNRKEKDDEVVSEICNNEMDNAESSVAETVVSEFIENKENDEINFETVENVKVDEIQNKDTAIEAETVKFESEYTLEEMDTS